MRLPVTFALPEPSQKYLNPMGDLCAIYARRLSFDVDKKAHMRMNIAGSVSFFLRTKMPKRYCDIKNQFCDRLCDIKNSIFCDIEK